MKRACETLPQKVPEIATLVGWNLMPLAVSLEEFHTKSQESDSAPTPVAGDRWRLFTKPYISTL